MKRRRKKLMIRLTVAAALTAIIITCAITLLDKAVYPAALELGEIQMKNRCMQIINDASDEAVQQLGTADMVITERDSEGRITMLTANSDYLNQLNGLIVELSLRKLEEDMPFVSVPMGTALGSAVFADVGPELIIRTTCSGVAQADYESDFESAGINQVRFRMIILISIEMRMVLGWQTRTVLVDNQQLVHESVIIGSVPDGYITRFGN